MNTLRWTVDASPNWKPLKAALGQAGCHDYMHMGRTGTVQHYKHRDFRTYLHIDASTGMFLTDAGSGYSGISQAEAMLRLRVKS